MKIFPIAFCAIPFLIFTASLFAQSSTPDSSAFISLSSNYPGLPVLINGKEAGFTPLRHWPLPPGKHEIAVKRARPESWLDFDWTEVCSLQAGDTLDFVARFQRGYSINSTPYGAEVLANEVLQGTTPLVVRLAEGEIASVEIRKAGYQSETLQIGGGVSEIRIYQVDLKPEQNLPLAQEVEKTGRRFRLHRNRRISMAAAGLSLVSGITAILLKDKADHFYDQYLTAGRPENREHFFQRTEDYDRYAGIATVVFEASFAVSFYYFLKSTRE
jgi:hypothetical protein